MKSSVPGGKRRVDRNGGRASQLEMDVGESGLPSNKPQNIPTIVGGLGVVLYSQIDERHRPTGSCRNLIHGAGEVGPAWGLAICRDQTPAATSSTRARTTGYPSQTPGTPLLKRRSAKPN